MANVIVLQIKHQCQLTQHHVAEIRAKRAISHVQTLCLCAPKALGGIDQSIYVVRTFFWEVRWAKAGA